MIRAQFQQPPKTLEEFYSEIRKQQERAHGRDYCHHHDSIVACIKEGQCSSYKELGTHQGATAAAALLSGKIKKIELVDISFDIFNPNETLFTDYCEKHNSIKFTKREIDSSSFESISKEEDDRYDILLIDSRHHPEHMRKELNIHSDRINKYIIAHDTSLPTDQLWKELQRFISINSKKWKLKERNTTNVGYTVIERI